MSIDVFDSFLDEIGHTKLAREEFTAAVLPRDISEMQADEKAASFYKKVKSHLEGLGYKVDYNFGQKGTKPPDADLIVAHSTSSGRLLDAHSGAKTVAFGASVPRSKVGAGVGKIDSVVNNPKDAPPSIMSSKSFQPTDDHFVFTDEMGTALDRKAEEHGVAKPWSKRVMGWMRSKMGFLFEEGE